MGTINLLPENYLRHRRHRRADAICLVLMVVVIGGVLCAAAVSKRNATHTLAIRDRVNASYAEAARLISQMHDLEVQKSKMLRKAELTASLVERVPRSTLLAIVTNALPAGTSLTDLELTTQRIIKHAEKPEGGKQTGSRLTTKPRKSSFASADVSVSVEITGLAGTDVQVARFIANLARNPLMASVDLVYSEEKKIKDVTVREFQIKTELKGQADAIEFVRPAQVDAPDGQAGAPDGETQ